jgi:hypothetical protein
LFPLASSPWIADAPSGSIFFDLQFSVPARNWSATPDRDRPPSLRFMCCYLLFSGALLKPTELRYINWWKSPLRIEVGLLNPEYGILFFAVGGCASRPRSCQTKLSCIIVVGPWPLVHVYVSEPSQVAIGEREGSHRTNCYSLNRWQSL